MLAIVAVVMAVFLSMTALTAWAPIIHWTCQRQSEAASLSNYYLPAVLVNSPYGGNAWGNGTIPVNFPGAWNGPPPASVSAVAFGTGASLGETLGAFFTVNVSFYHVTNLTEWGPGQNIRCSQPFLVTFGAPSLYSEAGGWVMGPNNTSDSSEPNFAVLFQGTRDASDSLFFNNSYVDSNRVNVTTCGGSAQSLPLVTSTSLTIWFPLAVGGKNYTTPYELTFEQDFHYWFPADFGTWQVDNLSAPGGPGGGLAFSYSPCP